MQSPNEVTELLLSTLREDLQMQPSSEIRETLLFSAGSPTESKSILKKGFPVLQPNNSLAGYRMQERSSNPLPKAPMEERTVSPSKRARLPIVLKQQEERLVSYRYKTNQLGFNPFTKVTDHGVTFPVITARIKAGV
jgi:hypothetical protein